MEVSEALPYDPDHYYLNHDLYSPEDAETLAKIRAHCIGYPNAILLDAYQAVTALEQKHPPGSQEAQKRFISGLRDEVGELHHELLVAQLEDPYLNALPKTEPEDIWLTNVIDPNRIAFPYMREHRKEHVLSELGDVLWYAARVAAERGRSLSELYFDFLVKMNPRGVWSRFDPGLARPRAGTIMDFELAQRLASDTKEFVTGCINAGTPVEDRFTIDQMPAHLLAEIYGGELFANPAAGDDIPEQPYGELPNIDLAIGKLIWFVGYSAGAMINSEFSTVMRANLEKVLNRSRRGTIFSKSDRDGADESSIRAGQESRMPLG